MDAVAQQRGEATSAKQSVVNWSKTILAASKCVATSDIARHLRRSIFVCEKKEVQQLNIIKHELSRINHELIHKFLMLMIINEIIRGHSCFQKKTSLLFV